MFTIDFNSIKLERSLWNQIEFIFHVAHINNTLWDKLCKQTTASGLHKNTYECVYIYGMYQFFITVCTTTTVYILWANL